ncbi:MAG: TlpA family protein disulfide reductase [Sciscionella sp.]
MRIKLRLLWLSPAFRWGAVVAIVAVAAVIALWPRGQAQHAAAPSPAPRPAVNLHAARAAAHLPACPSATEGTRSAAKSADEGALHGITLSCLGTGDPLPLPAALAGHTTVLNIWASWCSPCRGELPVLQAYAHSAGAVSVLGVQVDSDPGDGLRLLRSLGVALPTAYDRSGSLLRALGAPANLPVSYVIDPDGSAHLVSAPRVFHSVAEVAGAVARYGGGNR